MFAIGLAVASANPIAPCTVESIASDSCEYAQDGECDNGAFGGVYDICSGDCGDVFDCRVLHQDALGCDACVAAGYSWCGAGALCAAFALDEQSIANSGDVALCGNPTAWSEECGASANPLASDTAYDSQAWVYELINVKAAWEEGWTGAGVQIVINDDGIDTTHPDLSPHFSEEGSCVGSNVLHTGDMSHGTATAAIAAGAANSECSMGIAPEATIAGCPILADPSVAGVDEIDPMTFGLDVNDISSNSWGIDPCSALERRRDRARRRALQETTEASSCPFDGAAADSPCNEAACFDGAGASWGWTDESGRAQCEAAVSAYCFADESRWYVDAQDGGCADFWYLTMECAYNDLSGGELQALLEGVTVGRGGKGTVYVFSSGNEHLAAEDVNYEGYLFTRFTIAVGAVGKLGAHASYSTAGAALLVSAPGGDHEFSVNHVVAQQGGGCGNAGVGTSYAAPVVSGVVALMLQANPQLGWRDVQGVLAYSAHHTDADDASWASNAAGLWHSAKYGFGLVDAHAAVHLALAWPSYGSEVEQVSTASGANVALPNDGSGVAVVAELQVAELATPIVAEHVYVYLQLEHARRGDLHIELVSPLGTRSVLIPGPRPEDEPGAGGGVCSAAADGCAWADDGVCDAPDWCVCDYNDCLCSAEADSCAYADDDVCDVPDYCSCDYNDCAAESAPPSESWPLPYSGWPFTYGPEYAWNWKMVTVRTWGESPVGTWRLEMTDAHSHDTSEPGNLVSWSVVVYGHDATHSVPAVQDSDDDGDDTPVDGDGDDTPVGDDGDDTPLLEPCTVDSDCPEGMLCTLGGRRRGLTLGAASTWQQRHPRRARSLLFASTPPGVCM